jgi:uncharacterized protein (DUF2249 family)
MDSMNFREGLVLATFDAVINVTELKPIDRLGVIYTTFDSLESGQRMEIINDHDPIHLHQKLGTDRGGQFDWKYLQEGPVEWRIAITKI